MALGVLNRFQKEGYVKQPQHHGNSRERDIMQNNSGYNEGTQVLSQATCL